MLRRPCLVCGAPAADARCDQHRPKSWRTRPQRDRTGWNAKVAQVHRRDRTCVMADGTCEGRLEVDHEVGLADGGPDHLDNLRLLCAKHHKAHTAAQARARRERRHL